MEETVETRGAEETIAFGRRFAERLGTGDCVALIGPLGSGKTVLVRGIALGMGLADERMVSSPTYVLVQEYQARIPLYHVDLYRLADAEAELSALGIEEMLADGVVLIEWAEKASGALRRPRWEVLLSPTGADERRLTVHRVD